MKWGCLIAGRDLIISVFGVLQYHSAGHHRVWSREMEQGVREDGAAERAGGATSGWSERGRARGGRGRASRSRVSRGLQLDPGGAVEQAGSDGWWASAWTGSWTGS